MGDPHGLGHADLHPGNCRLEPGKLWVLDWGSNVRLRCEKRQQFCLLIAAVAAGASDRFVAEIARKFGLKGENDAALADIVKGILNASPPGAAQETGQDGSLNQICDDLDHDIVPVIRCLAMLGGMLKEMQKELQQHTQQDVHLSLAALWHFFAQKGLDRDEAGRAK